MQTDNEADARLLSLANEKGKFGITIGYPMDEALRDAFERGIDSEWFTLVDVAVIEHSDGQICRIFRLTDAGKQRRHALTLLGW